MTKKNAWKVDVTTPHGEDPPDIANTWNDADNTTAYDVTVNVFDWQIGANVDPDLQNTDDIYAASEVGSVSVEIPGMNSSLPIVNTPDSGLGTPDDPLMFTIPIVNENLLAAGEYIGLVKVSDERTPLNSSDGRDFLMDSPDGILLEHYSIPEFTTYQTLMATVVVGNVPVGNVIIKVNRQGYRNVINESGPFTFRLIITLPVGHISCEGEARLEIH